MCAAIGWCGAAALGHMLPKMDQQSSLIVLQRDGGEGGRVRLHTSGHPSVEYTVRSADTASMIAALESAARIAVAAGATSISTCQTGMPSHTISDEYHKRARPGDNPPLEAWLAEVRKVGLRANAVGLFSAHQMGSNRMGVEPAESVVDEDGEVWHVDLLLTTYYLLLTTYTTDY